MLEQKTAKFGCQTLGFKFLVGDFYIVFDAFHIGDDFAHSGIFRNGFERDHYAVNLRGNPTVFG